MKTRFQSFGTALLTTLLAFGITACDDTTGPEGPGSATIQLTGMDAGAQSVATRAVAADPRFASVTLDDVESISVTIDRVEAHREGTEDDPETEEDEGEGSGGWFGIDVEASTVDLIQDLSADQSITVAEGELPAGDYDQVRFFFSEATITFASTVEVPGPGEDIAGGEAVALTIPSGAQTGIKVPDASFSVGEGATEVTIVFDEGTSVQNVTVTGTGEVIMAPVLVAGGEEGGDEN